MVMVPVLSRQSTSTWASSSTVASSFAKALRRARTITPTTKANEVRSTRPSGTIATAAPTVLRKASCQPLLLVSKATSKSPAANGTTTTSTRRILLTPSRSSELTKVNRRASSLSLLA